MMFITIIRNGIMLGVRHFEPDEIRSYYEIHIYLILFQINIFITNKINENENS
jgi:hypothetical protein